MSDQVRTSSVVEWVARAALGRLSADRRAWLVAGMLDEPDTLAALAHEPDLLERLVGLAADDPDLERRVVRAASRIDFEAWERHGWHLTANRFDSVIPDTRDLDDSLWKRRNDLPGVELRDSAQVALLTEASTRWGTEFNALPAAPAGQTAFDPDNHDFGPVDAEIYYTLVRAGKPRTVIEIGAGWSTVLADRALAVNEDEGYPGRLMAIEPYPHDFVRDAARLSPRVDLRVAALQTFSLEPFEALRDRDILSIDSSHACRIGSDVQYEILELLPRLAPGVLVHFQGIFLPEEYPREWVLGPERRFWNEQYLLQAFLAFNRAFEVVWASAWMHLKHPGLLERHVAAYDRTRCHPRSLWLRRVER